MAQMQKFELWFDNQSLSGGQALVYQSPTNVTATSLPLLQLAWMLVGANPSVLARFRWSIAYDFIWSDQVGSTGPQQTLAADLRSPQPLRSCRDFPSGGAG